MKQNFTLRLLLFVILVFLVCAVPRIAVATSYFQDTLGLNNPSNEMELVNHEDLTGLNLSWISDSVFRSNIEYEEGGVVKYDWTKLNEMLDAYVGDLGMHLWLVVNPLSVIKTTGARKYRGKYLPIRGEAMDLYATYLKELVKYTKRYQEGFRVSYWSVYNEPHRPYLTVFGETEADIQKAANAYVRLVKKTYKILSRLQPGAQMVLGGVASNVKSPHIQFFHKVLERLDQLDPLRENNGYFDYFDFHDYNYFNKYKVNRTGVGYNYFKRELLEPYGFRDKVIVLKEGATHTGMDLSAGAFLKRYQTEREQAEYAIKRAIFNYGQGARNVQWSTLREHDLFRGTPHYLFCYNGFTYNGSPTGDEEWFDPALHIADPKIIITQDPADPNLYTFTTAIFREGTGWDYKSSAHIRDEIQPALTPEQQAELLAEGTIEISDGIKKLAYYTYKFMAEKLRDCDLHKYMIDKLRRNDDGDKIYLYSFQHADGTRIYVAWWDWFNELELSDKTVTLHLPWVGSEVRIIKAIPEAESGADAQIFLGQYPDFFPSTTSTVSGQTVVITLDKMPVFIEPL